MTSELSKILEPALRSFIGLDREMENFLFDSNKSYPPYNIKRVDNGYILEIALAGFKKSDIEVTVENNILKIVGQKDKCECEYIHKGIAARQFVLSILLSMGTRVEDARMEDGLLVISCILEDKKDNIYKIDIKS